MPISISSDAIEEKNKLTSDGAWIILLQFVLTDGSEIFLCRNTEDVTWPSSNGDLYTAFPFDIVELGDNSRGEVPAAAIQISNISRALIPYLEDADGGNDAQVRIMIVHSKHLDNTTPEVDLQYKNISSGFDSRWVTFRLGADNPHNKIFPAGRMLKTFCRYKVFGPSHPRCTFPTSHGSYDGNGCDRTLGRCRELWTQVGQAANVNRFGGAPAVGGDGLFD